MAILLEMFAIPAQAAVVVPVVIASQIVRRNASWIVLNAYIRAGRLITPPLLFYPMIKYRLTGFLFFLLKGINRLVVFAESC